MTQKTITLTEVVNLETMDSREIAKLTGKRHDHVIRDIEKMLIELGDGPKVGLVESSYNNQDVGGAPKVGETYTDSMGKIQKCYKLPKLECLTLVSGYSAKLRKAIISRWLHLESELVAILKSETDRVTLLLERANIQLENTLIVEGNLTVKTFCNDRGVSLEFKDTARNFGAKCALLSTVLGHAVGRIPHSEHRTVNTYSIQVLETVVNSQLESS